MGKVVTRGGGLTWHILSQEGEDYVLGLKISKFLIFWSRISASIFWGGGQNISYFLG